MTRQFRLKNQGQNGLFFYVKSHIVLFQECLQLEVQIGKTLVKCPLPTRLAFQYVCLQGFANNVVPNQDGSDSLFQFHPLGWYCCSNPINYGPLSNVEPFLLRTLTYHVRDPFFFRETTIIQLT